jgi:hypothetical protein
MTVFMFDVKLEVSDKLDVVTVDIPCSHKNARFVSVRRGFKTDPAFSDWGILTVWDSGEPSITPHTKTAIIVRAKQNGLVCVPEGAGRPVGEFVANWTDRWVVFDEAPAPRRTAAKPASPEPPREQDTSSPRAPTDCSCPASEPPPPEEGVPW